MQVFIVDENAVRASALADIAYRSAKRPGAGISVLDAYLMLGLYEQNPGMSVEAFKQRLDAQHQAFKGPFPTGFETTW